MTPPYIYIYDEKKLSSFLLWQNLFQTKTRLARSPDMNREKGSTYTRFP